MKNEEIMIIEKNYSNEEYIALLKIFVLLSSSKVYQEELKGSEYNKDKINLLFENMQIKFTSEMFMKDSSVEKQNVLDELIIYGNTLEEYDKLILDFLLLPYVFKTNLITSKGSFRKHLLLNCFQSYFEIPTFRILLNDFLHSNKLLFVNANLEAKNTLLLNSPLNEKMLCVANFLWVLKFLSINSKDRNKSSSQVYTKVLKNLLKLDNEF